MPASAHSASPTARADSLQQPPPPGRVHTQGTTPHPLSSVRSSLARSVLHPIAPSTTHPAIQQQGQSYFLSCPLFKVPAHVAAATARGHPSRWCSAACRLRSMVWKASRLAAYPSTSASRPKPEPGYASSSASDAASTCRQERRGGEWVGGGGAWGRAARGNGRGCSIHRRGTGEFGKWGKAEHWATAVQGCQPWPRSICQTSLPSATPAHLVGLPPQPPCDDLWPHLGHDGLLPAVQLVKHGAHGGVVARPHDRHVRARLVDRSLAMWVGRQRFSE